MKIIDNRQESKTQQESMWAKLRKPLGKTKDELLQEEQIHRQSHIKVTLDWRIINHLLPLVQMVWREEQESRTHHYIKEALLNRNHLANLIIEPHEPSSTDINHHTYDVFVGEEAATAIRKEARRAGLSETEYVLAILYTTAKLENEKRLQSLRDKENDRIENTPVEFKGGMSKKLYRKLIEEYGDPAVTLNGVRYPFGHAEGLGNYLLDIAEKHLGIKE